MSAVCTMPLLSLQLTTMDRVRKHLSLLARVMAGTKDNTTTKVTLQCDLHGFLHVVNASAQGRLDSVCTVRAVNCGCKIWLHIYSHSYILTHCTWSSIPYVFRVTTRMHIVCHAMLLCQQAQNCALKYFSLCSCCFHF